MPNIIINSMTVGVKKSTKGEDLGGLLIKGTKLPDQHTQYEEDWEKFYYDFTGEPEFFSPFKEGDAISIRNKRDGKFWKVDTVLAIAKPARGPNSPPEREPTTGAVAVRQPTPVPAVAAPKAARTGEQLIRVSCLEAVIKYMNILMPTYKKTTKQELYDSDVIRYASLFTKFISEGVLEDSIPESNANDLSGKATVDKEPALPPVGDDEVPPPGEDDIPF